MKVKDLWKFVGRKNTYSIQVKNGTYIPIRKPLTENDLKAHLAGTKTLGSYVINEDGKVNFGVIDIDEPPKTFNYDRSLRLSEIIYPLFPEFERVLEFSGRRGFHIWLILSKPETPMFIRELIKSRLKLFGIRNVEVYPKQNELSGKKLGNLIKIPLGKHIESGKFSKILKWERGKNE